MWKEVHADKVPGWNRDLLPDDVPEKKPPDWKPPPPPKVELSLLGTLEQLRNDTTAVAPTSQPAKREIYQDASREELSDLMPEDIVLVFGDCGIARMTVREFLKAKQNLKHRGGARRH